MKNWRTPRFLEGETWKQIEGYPGYEVSDMGRVKQKRPSADCVLSQATRKYGYKFVCLRKFDDKWKCQGAKGLYVHRLVAKAFNGGPPEEGRWEIDHIDGDAKNNVPSNLRWVTRQENMHSAFERNGYWLANAKRATVAIMRVTPDTWEAVRYESIKAATVAVNEELVAKNGVARPYAVMAGNICHARGLRKLAYAYHWCEPGKEEEYRELLAKEPEGRVRNAMGKFTRKGQG